MPRADADRNLLFGILALQMDFVTRDALVAAMNAWALEKHRPLGEILVNRGALDPLDRALLDPMVDRHVAKHGGDPLASLAALSSAGALAADLGRAVADPDVHRSLASIAPGDPFATRAAVPPDPLPAGSRYQKAREHARGNLGVVFVARDTELNREVALKEIQDRHAFHPHHRSKFLLEAEVTGGLEHPGIVPVYGLGHHEDGRPFYAMRFIRGDSLKVAIARFHAEPALKSDPGARALALQKLLRRFTDVCNAIDYAHSRGVLHRDLKPDNVMVGKYGETLVVDWGLARTLGRSGDDPAPLPESILQPTTASNLAETMPGSLVGTPAYMSPEQAAGRLDLLGPASDVYGLGATLHHLLTGRPPVEGQDLVEILEKIRAGDLPRPRSLSPWLDPALEAIALKAMATKPEARYATPRALAEDLDRWIAGEPVAAYPEPFARRARRWARRHRTAVTATAATATVAAVLLGGAAWLTHLQTQRTDAAALLSLARANDLEVEARATASLAKWSEAVAEARRAEARLESGGGSADLRSRVKARLAALESGETRRREEIRLEEKDRRMVDELDEARLRRANIKDGHYDAESMHEAYLFAFRTYGIDVATLPVESAAARVRSSRIGDELIAALDDWGVTKPGNIPAEKLDAIARTADTLPASVAIREATARGDAGFLRKLLEDEKGRRGLGSRVRLVLNALRRLDPAAVIPLLEAIQRDNPSDFWFNHDLATAYSESRPPRAADAIGYYRAAVALRPSSPGVHVNLGVVLAVRGDAEGSVASFREAIRLKPDLAEAHDNLGNALGDRGDAEGSVAAHREAIRLKPDLANAHNNLGVALRARGDAEGSVASYREAIRLKPELANAHANLGVALGARGDAEGSIASYREAIRLKRDYAYAHANLGVALAVRGDAEGSIASFREAIRLKPDYADAHCNLGLGLMGQGRFADALNCLERGHELGSRRLDWRAPSARWVAECRRLVELDARLEAIREGGGTPRDADERLALADLCYMKGLLGASARFYGEALAERPALGEDPARGTRYNAACAAALVGSGRGKDDPPPDEAARAGWRAKALGWLRDDLSAWGKRLEGGTPEARAEVVRTLAHWKGDGDLAGIRDEEDLGKLPEAEREAFRAIWADVEALRRKAEGAGGGPR